MDNFEIIDFNTLERRKRKAILNHAIKDMDRVAMQRKRKVLSLAASSCSLTILFK